MGAITGSRDGKIYYEKEKSGNFRNAVLADVLAEITQKSFIMGQNVRAITLVKLTKILSKYFA